MGGYPLIWLFAAACVGAGVGSAMEISAAAPLAVGLLCLVAGARAYHRRLGTVWWSILCVACLGAASARQGATDFHNTSSAIDSPDCPNGSGPSSDPSSGQYIAEVDAGSERVFDADGQFQGQRTILNISHQRCGSELGLIGRRFSVFMPHAQPLLRGDVLVVSGELLYAESPRNPVGPDPRFLARKNRIAGKFAPAASFAKIALGGGPMTAVDHWRYQLARQIESTFSFESSALIKALLLADRGGITPDRRQRWARSGVAHLLAVSGLHMGMVGALAYGLAALFLVLVFGERIFIRRWAAIIAALFVISFCLWTGAPISATRAAIMTVAVFLGFAVGRNAVALNSLALAGLLLVLADTTALIDPGFLLSFSAVTALLLMPSPKAQSSTMARWLAAAKNALLTSCVAAAATIPATLYFFGQVSVIAPAANIIAVPIATIFVLPLALLWAALQSTSLGPVLAKVLEMGIGVLERFVSLSASPSWAALHPPRPSIWEVVGVLVILVSAIVLRDAFRRRLKLPWQILLAAIAILVLLSPRILASGGDGRLSIEHIYVGQGDAALITFPQGTTMLYDGGGAIPPSKWDPGENIVAPLLRRRGILKIDYVVISHSHPDHIDGLVYIAENFSVGELWWNGDGPHLPSIRRILRGVEASGGEVRRSTKLGETLTIDGVEIRLSHPGIPPSAHADSDCDADDDALLDKRHPRIYAGGFNDRSVTLRFEFGERSYFLGGDIEESSEAKLGASLEPVDIFKASHHGSRTSSTVEFLDAAKASMVIISCGFRNTFGFPHPEVKARLNAAKLSIWRTDRDGLVQASTDGKSWWISGWRGRRETLFP